MSPASMQAIEEKQVEIVRSIFNRMHEEYDHVTDLWYHHTFGTIDRVLRDEFALHSHAPPKPVALDVGCGTGIQSLRLASLGYRVIGIDIAENLLAIAQEKLTKARYNDAVLEVADAQSLPFEDSIADCVNCCGPTLSFVPDWRTSLAEIARCLKPGGRLLLEVEGKWNFDLFWEVINAIGFNFLEYDEPLSIALRHFVPPWRCGYVIDYSFKLESGETVSMPLKLFTASELQCELKKLGLATERRWGLHILTNLIPSTVLHKANPGKLTRHFFDVLAMIENTANGYWPFNTFGCSLLVIAQKREDSP